MFSVFSLLFFCIFKLGNSAKYNFSEDFKFGVATGSYQVEGGWNANGKGENIWDYVTHTFPNRINNQSNGDIACDSYNKIDEDIQNLKALKVDFYRFSISWSRLLPSGFSNVINKDGIRYYSELINKLRDNNIEPVVTIFHWDLPQSLQELGGWANPDMVEYFVFFARICFKEFGDKVKTWITINEPLSICMGGYGAQQLAPYLRYSDGIGTYLCGHHLILGHAKVYRLYKKEFYESQKGRLGMTIESSWWEPAIGFLPDAAERMRQMYFGWFAHPIYSKTGDYPKILRQRIDDNSKKQKFNSSRLPYFSKDEIEMVRGSFDFLGLNHYTTFYVIDNYVNPLVDIVLGKPSFVTDFGVIPFPSPFWESTGRITFKVVPWGLRKLLQWIKNEYNNPEVIITENGYAGAADESLNDTARIRYHNGYLTELLNAINEDNCTVTAYTAWSLMDNFEWGDGYSLKFGMYQVDFNDPKRTRTPRQSAAAYRNIIETREISGPT